MALASCTLSPEKLGKAREEFVRELRSYPFQDEKYLTFGGKEYTYRQLIKEIEEETQFGKGVIWCIAYDAEQRGEK